MSDKELEKTLGHVNACSELIDGLDFYKGLERFGGDSKSYLDILRSFALNTRPLLESMKKLSAGESDNLADYGITVHGIKGSCRGICAASLGDLAEALEKAAKAGNLSYVTDNNAAFIEKTEKLIADVEDLIRKKTPQIKKPKKDKPDRKELLKLMTACEEYQMDIVDLAMTEIEKYEYETEADLVLWLRENVDQMNFVEIAEKLNPIVQ